MFGSLKICIDLLGLECWPGKIWSRCGTVLRAVGAGWRVRPSPGATDSPTPWSGHSGWLAQHRSWHKSKHILFFNTPNAVFLPYPSKNQTLPNSFFCFVFCYTSQSKMLMWPNIFNINFKIKPHVYHAVVKKHRNKEKKRENK